MPGQFQAEFSKNPKMLEDGRLDAQAFHRNSPPILAGLTRVIGRHDGHVLEVGSGTGQHAVAFARTFPRMTWWPTDPSPAHRQSIAAWRRLAGLGNLMDPMELDGSAPSWPLGIPGYPPDDGLAAIVCINVLHIAPWTVAEGLLAGAARHLGPDGRLILYGPYAVGGSHTTASNAAFDASLRAQDPRWGVRDIDDVAALAATHRLALAETIPMPSNNLMLVLSADAGR